MQITIIVFLIATVGTYIIAFLLIKSHYKFKKTPPAEIYEDKKKSKIIDESDIFINSKTEKVKIKDD